MHNMQNAAIQTAILGRRPQEKAINIPFIIIKRA